jgi:hypothetical protein
MYRISTGLRQQGWENVLRMEANTRDIFSDLEGVYSDEKKSLPNGIVVNVTLKPGEHQRTLPFLEDLGNTGVEGEVPMLTNETDQSTKHVTVYSNDVANAVNTEKYGIHAHDKKAYNLLKMVQPQLSKWHKQRKGRYFREALLQRYSRNLTVAPISMTQHWAPNILVKNVDMTAQPAYDSTLATYTEQIGDALELAGTTSAAQWDVTYLESIILWASGGWDSSKIIEPLNIDGRDMWVVTVPSRQAAVLKNPTAANSIAGLEIDAAVQKSMNNAFKQYLGNYGPLILVEDPLAPVLARGGSDGSWTLTAYYKDVGNADTRASATGTLFDVGFVLGKGALCKATHEEMHFEEEATNYGKIVGVGAFAGYGVQAISYDEDAATDTSIKTPGYGVLLGYRGAYTA